MDERIETAEQRAQDARRAALCAQQKVNALKREASQAERKKRAHLLIKMGAEMQALGLKDASEVGRFIATLRGWTYTDKTGTRKAVLDAALSRALSAVST